MDQHNSNRGAADGPDRRRRQRRGLLQPVRRRQHGRHRPDGPLLRPPGPGNLYHYHKYPVCVKSPFVDEGEEHSPLIGWAFDGFPIYGPYEAKRLMAKDDTAHPLNAFNMHYDEERGWHYHVTPGKFPYIIGGYYGELDRPTSRRGPRRPRRQLADTYRPK